MNLEAEVLTMLERETERRARLRAKGRPRLVATRQPLEIVYPPAAESDFRNFTTKYSLSLPDDLCSWLSFHNGACLGRGLCYGVNTADPRIDAQRLYSFFTEWPRHRWIPVGDDGCGNYYVQVIRTAPPHPIAFIDTIQDPNKVAYCVASGVWQFLWFSLTEAETAASRTFPQGYTFSFW